MQKKLAVTLGLATILAFSVLLAIPGPVKAWDPDDGTWEEFGPRIDDMYIRIYGDYVAEFEALQGGDIDIGDWPLTKTYIDRWSSDPSYHISIETLAEIGEYEFDVNNNLTTLTYPNWPNPTYYVEMRKAMSYLSDKDFYITDILGGYGVKMTAPIMPWTSWYNPDIETYDYSRAQAKYWLDQKFPEGTTDVPAEWKKGDAYDATHMRTYPTGHPKVGQNLDPLIGYGRLDKPNRLETGRMLRDELRSMGIPVTYNEADRSACFSRVMSYMDYHFYTGGWSLGNDPDNLFDLYSSYQNYFWLAGDPYNPAPYPHLWLSSPPFAPDVGPNYIGYQSPAFDNAARDCKFAGTAVEAKYYGDIAQEIMADEAAYIPLWTTAGYTGWRNDRLDCVINTAGTGVHGFYTWLNARPIGTELGGSITWGWSADVEKLNPAYSSWVWDWFVLGEIYDTPLTTDPFTIEWMPNAASCEEGFWSYSGKTATKLTFRFRPDIYTSDGVQYTAADLKWLIDIGKTLVPSPWWYASIMQVDHTETPDALTLIVYFKVKSFLASHWIGSLPMMPKHIWQTISDWTTDMPDPNLIGNGPYKFVSRTLTSIHLAAFKPTSPGYFNYAAVRVYNVKTSVGGKATTSKVTAYVKNYHATDTLSVSVTLKVGTDNLGAVALNNIAPGAIASASWVVSSYTTGSYTLEVAHPGPAGKPSWGHTETVTGMLNTLEGDVNGDRKVDLGDTVLFSTRWSWALSDYPNEDLNNDGAKSSGDIPYIVYNYGSST